MWFGDSVAPYEWSDLWLNEGHASWYEFVYAEEKGFLADDTVGYPDDEGYDTLEELMRATYAHSDQWRHDYGPVAAPNSPDNLFSLNVYHGGALVLYALRQVVGRDDVRAHRARVGRPLPRRRGEHRGLHRARLEGRPSRPARLPARVGLRRDDAEDARPPGLDDRSGRGDPAVGEARAGPHAAPLDRPHGAGARAVEGACSPSPLSQRARSTPTPRPRGTSRRRAAAVPPLPAQRRARRRAGARGLRPVHRPQPVRGRRPGVRPRPRLRALRARPRRRLRAGRRPRAVACAPMTATR